MLLQSILESLHKSGATFRILIQTIVSPRPMKQTTVDKSRKVTVRTWSRRWKFLQPIWCFNGLQKLFFFIKDLFRFYLKIRSWKVSCSIFLLFVSPLFLFNRISVYCIVFLLSPLSPFSYGVLFGLYPALRRVNEFDRSVTGSISFCVKISTSVYL